MRSLIQLLIIYSLLPRACGLGCLSTICKSNSANELIGCDGKFCGHYRAERRDGQLAEAVDIKCSPGTDVFAPFDGDLHFWRPYDTHECANEGVRIEGTGQWQGYHVLMTSVKLDFYGGKVKKGDKIGTAKDHRCIYGGKGEEHLRLQLFRKGRPIDPTFNLRGCMCTGQICETNPNNALLGQPFKRDSRYNGVSGWDIKCPMVTDEDEEPPRAPEIYSPIDANMIGRKRLYAVNGEYVGCDNNGIVLVGRDAWEGFEVVLYNVLYRKHLLGEQNIVQGEPIGTRLDCGDSPDSVFMEVRYHGAVVDISDMISGKLCKMPEFIRNDQTFK